MAVCCFLYTHFSSLAMNWIGTLLRIKQLVSGSVWIPPQEHKYFNQPKQEQREINAIPLTPHRWMIGCKCSTGSRISSTLGHDNCAADKCWKFLADSGQNVGSYCNLFHFGWTETSFPVAATLQILPEVALQTSHILSCYSGAAAVKGIILFFFQPNILRICTTNINSKTRALCANLPIKSHHFRREKGCSGWGSIMRDTFRMGDFR